VLRAFTEIVGCRTVNMHVQADTDDAAAQRAASGSAVAAVSISKHEDSPFLDPLVRSLILGVGAGIVCEAAHVFFQV